MRGTGPRVWAQSGYLAPRLIDRYAQYTVRRCSSILGEIAMQRALPTRSISSLEIPRRDHFNIRCAARAAACDQKEICGFFHQRNRYLRFVRVRNRCSQPGHFSLQNSALRIARVASEGIWGVFHSHPISEANPSQGDRLGGGRFGYMIIYDVLGDEYRLWQIDNNEWHLRRRFEFDRRWIFPDADDDF